MWGFKKSLARSNRELWTTFWHVDAQAEFQQALSSQLDAVWNNSLMATGHYIPLVLLISAVNTAPVKALRKVFKIETKKKNSHLRNSPLQPILDLHPNVNGSKNKARLCHQTNKQTKKHHHAPAQTPKTNLMPKAYTIQRPFPYLVGITILQCWHLVVACSIISYLNMPEEFHTEVFKEHTTIVLGFFFPFRLLSFVWLLTYYVHYSFFSVVAVKFLCGLSHLFT